MSSEDFSTLSGMYPVLTDSKLSKALSDWYGENITFTRWEYVGATGKGDSYLSEVIRIKIFGKTDSGDPKHVQVILKSIPRSVSRRLTFRSDEFFKNEIIFYEHVLPALLKFQSAKNVSEPFDNYPRLFLTHCDGENDIICLEDASIFNFAPYAVRQEGIDIEHCKLTYKTVAKFHALSFALRDQDPEEFKRISDLIFETYYDERLWDWYEAFWRRLCSIAIDAVEKEYPNSIYVEKVKQFAVPERYKEMIKAVQNRENGVISHGDSWTNNFLYKYLNGRPVDAKMIDFQLTRCASPVLDTSFIIYGCTTEDMRLKHYDDLLKYYHEVLSSQIRAYGSDPDKIYSWETFMEEVKKYSFFGLAFSFESTPHIVLAPEDACDMDMKMGMFSSKVEEYSDKINYEFLCDSLTKWYGEPAFFAHVIYLDDYSTSFISEVVRWKVCAQHGTGQEYAELVLKFFPRNKTRGQSFRSADFFKNEISFYEHVLPQLLGFQKDHEISGRFDNHPRLCFTYCKEEGMICLGNLKVQGFANVKECMDIEHGKLTLRTLARFHALSFALKTQNRERFETISKQLSETYYRQNYWGWYKKLWSKICFVATKAVEEEYPDSIYLKKTKEFADPKRYKDLIRAVGSRQNDAILHGDCRESNYLFKYIDDRPVDVKMVDFRQARCASPALDVSCIIINNTRLFKDSEALLRYYHGNLVIRIRELGGDPDVYTFDMLMEDFRKYAYFGLAFSLEAACTRVTFDDIYNKLSEWDKAKGKIVNIADAYDMTTLANHERLQLVDSIVNCVNNGYI